MDRFRELIEQALSLLRLCGQKWTGIDRDANEIETDPTQPRQVARRGVRAPQLKGQSNSKITSYCMHPVGK